MILKKKINEKVSTAEAYQLAFGTPAPSGKVFCPFHNNTKTPAAKIYSYGLRCFGECNRVYTAYDILKKFAPQILEKLSETPLPSPKETKPNQTFPDFSLDSYYESY